MAKPDWWRSPTLDPPPADGKTWLWFLDLAERGAMLTNGAPEIRDRAQFLNGCRGWLRDQMLAEWAIPVELLSGEQKAAWLALACQLNGDATNRGRLDYLTDGGPRYRLTEKGTSRLLQLRQAHHRPPWHQGPWAIGVGVNVISHLVTLGIGAAGGYLWALGQSSPAVVPASLRPVESAVASLAPKSSASPSDARATTLPAAAATKAPVPARR